MRQIVYFSSAVGRQTSETIYKILVTARLNNRRDSITGLLVAGNDRYMQAIEGPDEAIERLYRNIRNDPRHVAVTTLTDKSVEKRSFANWFMAYGRDPRLGEIDYFPDLLRGLLQQTPDEVLRDQVQTFARVFMSDALGHARPRLPEAS